MESDGRRFHRTEADPAVQGAPTIGEEACGQRDRCCQGVEAVCDRRLKVARFSRNFRWSELGLKSQSHQQHYGGAHGAIR